MINIETVLVGEMQTNCYLLTDEESGHSAVVDPGRYTPALKAALEGKSLDYIMLTHGHFDHIGGVALIAENTGAQVVIGKKELSLLADPVLNLSASLSPAPMRIKKADITLSDGDSFMLGKTRISYMETPGHTAGSGCYIFDGCIISGDTLFYSSIGRTDFKTGSITDMLRSLSKLRELDGDYRVFPGHGQATTLDYERAFNPYMKENGYEDIY